MSEKYEASKEDVHFDNGRADQLMRQLREASEYLHTTDSTQRSGARDQAMTEFAGPYADLFAHNTETALRDGKRLGDALSDAANELQKYKELARLEQENRQKVLSWVIPFPPGSLTATLVWCLLTPAPRLITAGKTRNMPLIRNGLKLSVTVKAGLSGSIPKTPWLCIPMMPLGS